MNQDINKRTKLISLVIPVFNNSESLLILYSQISHQFQLIPNGMNYEVIFIDDGSIDDSWNLIVKLREEFPNNVRGIKLSRNFGQLAAMIAGWNHASGDAIINMSADLQDPPELIHKMIHEWESGSELVIGIRQNREDGFINKMTSALANRFMRMSNSQMPETWFDYTLMSSRVLSVLSQMTGRYRFTQGEMLYAGFKQSRIGYTRARRPFGHSGYNFWKRFENFTNTVLDSSYLLIKLFIRVGLMFSLFSVLYALWIIVARTLGWIPSTGWAPIMVLILTSSGIIMMMLGVIAEYLWRIYDGIRNKPAYVVEQEI